MIKIDKSHLGANEALFKKALKNTDKKLYGFLKGSMKKFNQVFVNKAKQNAKGMNVGKSLQSYDDELAKLVGGLAGNRAAYYAPYVEFGTRGKVDVPSGWEQIAKKYKGKSKFKSQVSFEKAIKLWIKKKLKKSDEEAEKLVFPIMMKIIKQGTEAKPFMVPAYYYAEKFLINYLNNNVKKVLQ